MQRGSCEGVLWVAGAWPPAPAAHRRAPPCRRRYAIWGAFITTLMLVILTYKSWALVQVGREPAARISRGAAAHHDREDGSAPRAARAAGRAAQEVACAYDQSLGPRQARPTFLGGGAAEQPCAASRPSWRPRLCWALARSPRSHDSLDARAPAGHERAGGGHVAAPHGAPAPTVHVHQRHKV